MDAKTTGPTPAASAAPQSAAATWAPLRRFIAAEARLQAWAEETPLRAGLYEFVRFGIKQGWACLFGGIMVGLMIATKLWYPAGAGLARYDFLFIAALSVQVLLLAFKLETLEEARVIFAYHVVGTVMEVFKTGVGSWIYPEASLFHIAGVPLFSGFMYSCIGSYICRAWRLFHIEFRHHPPLWALALLSVAIYVNFFSHHYIWDFRPLLFLAMAALCWRARFYFLVWRVKRWMPFLLGLFLVSVFIWISENVGTLTQTWLYPSQRNGWSMVGIEKLGSWFLLLTISYTLVALIRRNGAGEGRDQSR
ncbi:MAG: DUF817 domain-containing protein [Bauldia sp.]